MRSVGHAEHLTHAEAVKALLPTERPRCGTEAETLVEPGSDNAPVGEPPALGTWVRVVLEEKESGPLVLVTMAGRVHVHAPESDILESEMLAARLAVRPGQIFTPEIGNEAPRSTCHQFTPATQVFDEDEEDVASRAMKGFENFPSIALLEPYAAVVEPDVITAPAQLLDA